MDIDHPHTTRVVIPHILPVFVLHWQRSVLHLVVQARSHWLLLFLLDLQLRLIVLVRLLGFGRVFVHRHFQQAVHRHVQLLAG
jgi:hypothetical protein